MEVSCYDMHLYCDYGSDIPNTGLPYDQDSKLHGFMEMPHELTGKDRAECVRDARKMGWVFKRDGRTICPKCAKR